MNVVATQGRVIVTPDEAITSVSGYEVPEKKNPIGTIKAMGPPQEDIFTWFDKLKWALFKIHPAPFKVGDKVLMPSVTGRLFQYEGVPCYIFYQSEIELFFDAET